MKKLLLIFVLLANGVFAQSKEKVDVIYDVVYMKDGRVIKGEILLFEEKDGDLTFKDAYGRKYSITRKEYKYFVEDVNFSVNKKRDTVVVLPRKDKQFEFSLGFSISAAGYNHSFVQDDYYLQSNWTGNYFYTPICLKLGAGKYLSRENYVGLTSDLALNSSLQQFLNVGIRFSHQLDAHKSNKSFYIPVELQFNASKFDVGYGVNDTLADVQGGGTVYYYPRQMKTDESLKSIGLSIGQGMSFILPKKKSISIELNLFKNFVVAHDIIGFEQSLPKSSFKNSGLKFAFFYNL